MNQKIGARICTTLNPPIRNYGGMSEVPEMKRYQYSDQTNMEQQCGRKAGLEIDRSLERAAEGISLERECELHML